MRNERLKGLLSTSALIASATPRAPLLPRLVPLFAHQSLAGLQRATVPRQAANRFLTILLAILLASGSNQTLLAVLTVGSLNAALFSSASGATCVTGVTATFANVVNGVSGQPGTTVVTSVTPTFASALTNVQTNSGAFLTSAALTPATGTAVTSVIPTTGTVTGIAPTPGLPTDLRTVAFSPSASPDNASAAFSFPGGSPTEPNGGQIELLGSGVVGPVLTVPIVSGTPTSQQVVTSVTAPQQSNFLTSGTSVATTSANALTSVSTTNADFVNGIQVQTANVLTSATTTTVPVVASVTPNNSGASASASSLGCGVNDIANGTNSVASGANASTGAFNNSTAIGANAAAGTNSVALGQGAQALGVGSTAIGQGASTNSFNNAMAIGNGAVATRENQVVIGTASNTYTTPGITSAASRAAQSGPLQVVTSDASGNLATDGGAIFNNLNVLNQEIARVDQNLDQLNQAVKRLDGGVAMAMALGGVYLPEHQNVALHMNMGFYQGAPALGFQGVARLNQTFTVNGGLAIDLSGTGQVGGRVGISAGW